MSSRGWCCATSPMQLSIDAGSAVAFGKLHGLLASKPLSLPGKDVLNIGAASNLTTHKMNHDALDRLRCCIDDLHTLMHVPLALCRHGSGFCGCWCCVPDDRRPEHWPCGAGGNHGSWRRDGCPHDSQHWRRRHARGHHPVKQLQRVRLPHVRPDSCGLGQLLTAYRASSTWQTDMLATDQT